MMIFEKSLFNFTTLMTLKPNEYTTPKKSTEMKYFGRNNRNSFGQISVSNSSTRLQLSSVSRPPELAPHCANQWKLEFFLYLGNALIFTQNIQLVTMYEQYGSIK